MNARSAAPLVALVLGLGLVALLLAEPETAAPAPSPTGPVPSATEAPDRPPARLEPPSPATAAVPPATGARTLAGQVVDAASGAPISAARVAARGLSTGGVFTGETDAEGRFALGDVGPGQLEVIAVAEGWLVPEPTPVAADAREVSVRLVAGVAARGQVVLAPGQAGSLPARVEVRLVGASERFVGSFEPTFADADGRFVVPGVPPESGLSLVASAPGWAEARLDLPPVTGALDGLRLELRRLVVTGSVVAEGVTRSDDLVVIARAGEGDAAAVARAGVRPDGRFEAALPHVGDWLVRAEQPGAASPWQRVRVSDGAAPPDLQLILRAHAAISGRVVAPDGAPAAGAEVKATPTRGGESRSVRADAEGAFTLEATAGERYVLLAAKTSHAAAEQEVEAPGSGVVLRLGVGVRVEVTPFVGPGGRPLAGATLGCDPAGDGHDEHHGESAPAESFEVPLDAEGRPQLNVLPPGRWTLHLLEPVEGRGPGQELRGWVLEVEAREGEPVTLSLDASAPRGQVRGVVRGAPTSDLVQVELRPAEETEGAFQFIAACAAGSDGSFEFPAVPPGRYDVLATWEGGDARGQAEVTVGTPAWVELSPR